MNMVVKVGVNGIGRIGRCCIRAWIESGRDDIEIVAINFRQNTAEKAHLIKYDSTHGTLKQDVTYDDDYITIGDKKIRIFNHSAPQDIPWSEMDVDVVLECTGVFKSHAQASLHLEGGAKKVLISAPSSDPDAMIVHGVNNEVYKKSDQVISIGSCTTNCLAPVAKTLNDAIGIVSGFMTTIHAFTSDQNILDNGHKDLRRARTASASMIPASTGAAKALGVVLPELDGKLNGTAIRVPTQNVSFVDLTFVAPREVTAEEVNAAVKASAEGAMAGVLGYEDAPLVSIDFNGDARSSIFDASQTFVQNGTLVRVGAWYDNEWGFSNRMLDLAKFVG
jgi:glyceraldehyde 3-phosphate dehydrogenase